MSDLIERKEAIKAVWKPKVNPNDLIFDALKTAIESKINDIPSAERKGEWIESDTDGFICSACGNGYRNQPTCMGKPMFEYCQFCGARMKGTGDGR